MWFLSINESDFDEFLDELGINRSCYDDEDSSLGRLEIGFFDWRLNVY